MMRRLFITLVFILLCFPAATYANDNNLIRLHVLANSDENKDQELKLIVRDQVLEELKPISNINNTNEAIKYLKRKLKSLQSRLENKINEEGFNYSIKIQFDESDFPIRKYQNMVLPAGRYLALKVIIGEGKGGNWWCVLFPPICHGDWVQEPRRKVLDEENTISVITNIREQKEENSHKKFWKEYTKLILRVWSFSESP